jgi:hypothetical protein
MRANNTVFLLETLLFEGGALAWAAWQLWSVRPDKKHKIERRAELPPKSEEGAGHLEG